MNRARQWYLDATETEQGGRLPALDGARCVFVLLIAWYHIWQQSWLTPSGTLLGRYWSLDFLLRSGYMWVDALLLLSGFLLYLPHAEAAESQKKPPRALPFYRNRLLRVAPGYYLCVIVMLLFVALPEGSYRALDGRMDTARMLKDLAAHFTFTHTLFDFSYVGSPLNGALWTLGVEMQFYFLFPLLARAFRRWPAAVYGLMLFGALAYRYWAGTLADSTLYVNQLPAMLDVYANGMAAACVYSALKRRLKQDRWTRALFTGVFFVSVCAAAALLREQASLSGYNVIRQGQMDRRFALSILTALMLLGALYGARPVRLLLGNRVARVLSEMSFQFYMWHQVFAVRLKAWGVPVSAYDSPWSAGDRPWQQLYTAMCFSGALIISALVTYLFERPIARLGRGAKTQKRGKD